MVSCPIAFERSERDILTFDALQILNLDADGYIICTHRSRLQRYVRAKCYAISSNIP